MTIKTKAIELKLNPMRNVVLVTGNSSTFKTFCAETLRLGMNSNEIDLEDYKHLSVVCRNMDLIYDAPHFIDDLKESTILIITDYDNLQSRALVAAIKRRTDCLFILETHNCFYPNINIREVTSMVEVSKQHFELVPNVYDNLISDCHYVM